MNVRIHKSRQDGVTREIDLLCARGRRNIFADGGHFSVRNDHHRWVIGGFSAS